MVVVVPPSCQLRTGSPSQPDGISINRVTSHILRLITLPCLRLPPQMPALDRRLSSQTILASRLSRSQSWPTSGRDRRVLTRYKYSCVCMCVYMRVRVCLGRWSMQRASVLCSTCPTSPVRQDISNPEQDEPFWQNENPSCRTTSHDIVACLLSSQPGMVALEVVSTPFHIREANAARLHPGADFPWRKRGTISTSLLCCVV